MTTSCAGWRPILATEPPRLVLPDAARRPCALAVLPDDPVRADLEAAYMVRGAQIVACDGARRLAVDTLLAERDAQDRWRMSRWPLAERLIGRGARQNPPGDPANPAP